MSDMLITGRWFGFVSKPDSQRMSSVVLLGVFDLTNTNVLTVNQ